MGLSPFCAQTVLLSYWSTVRTLTLCCCCVVLQMSVSSAPATLTVQQVNTSYANSTILCAASHPGGGALLQTTTGALLYYTSHGRLQSVGASGQFPAPCPTMLPTPPALLPASQPSTTAPPALGLAAGGQLYWGRQLIAADVTSVAVRKEGPGGPALLYTTRQSMLYAVMLHQLPSYKHLLVSNVFVIMQNRPGELFVLNVLWRCLMVVWRVSCGTRAFICLIRSTLVWCGSTFTPAVDMPLNFS